MSQIVTQNPGSSEIQSPLIAGVTEGLNKISSILNLKTGTLDDVQLTPVSIDNQEKNKNRIYEANFGNRLWLSSPAPVIKKNGSEITQSGSNFTIDYIGGSITFSEDSKPSDSDTITVSATYIIAESSELEQINSTLSSVQTQSKKYKGNYDNVGALQLAYPSAQNGDFAIVFDPLAVYAWKNNGWYDTRSIEDLSDYYTKGETDNKLNQKEPTISAKGSSTSDDNYYWGGRKTWQDLFAKVRSTTLTGLSTASDAVVRATDTVLVALGKLQAQVSKATQRAYLSGTGAPSTSTVGVVGQRYVNTSNGDEYTCEEVSGDTYTWRLHTKSVNNKRPNSPGGNINLIPSDIGAATSAQGSKADSAMQPSVYDPNSEGIDVTVQTYVHSKSGTVHEFTGTGANGRAKMTADVSAGDTFTVNGSPVTALVGPYPAAGAFMGRAYAGSYISFILSDGVMHIQSPGDPAIEIQLLSSGWTGAEAPYSQTISVAGMTADRVFAAPTSGDNSQGMVAVSEALGLLCGAESSEGSVTMYASDKPEIDLSIILRG